MRNITTIILVTVGLSIGCHNNNEYAAYTRNPGLVLRDKYKSLSSDVRFNLKYLNLSVDIMSFRSRLDSSSYRVSIPYDVAASKTKRLNELKAKHSSMQESWRKFGRELDTIKRENAELQAVWDSGIVKTGESIENALQSLTEDGERLSQIEEQIKVYNERYAVDKKRYLLKKNKYREHLLKGLAANGISENHIYSDDSVVIYVDSIKVKKDSVSLILKAYLITLTGSHWPGSSFHAPPESKIFAYNTSGDSMGSPIDVTHVKHPETEGITLTLIYQQITQIGKGKVKLILQRSVLSNKKDVVIEIPYNLKEVVPPELPTKIVQTPLLKTEKDFVSKIETVTCKRVGEHLLVPVSLDIHGKSIQVEMVLDTGASVTIVPRRLYLKGNAKPFSKLRREKFETAKGAIQCYIDEVQVSTSAYSKTSLIAISDYDTPLLGANYFEDNVFTVDVENECIYVHPRTN